MSDAASRPEEESKRFVAAEFGLLQDRANDFEWACRLEDRGDFHVIYVRLQKPGGRLFVMRLECEDYPRQAPLVRFVDPGGWEDLTKKDNIDPAFHPRGGYVSTDRGPFPVMCLRGHRDYYANNWHPGWTNPPATNDAINQFVYQVRRAILEHWT